MTTATDPSSATTADARETLFTTAFVRLSAADLAYFTATGVAISTLPAYVVGPVGSDAGGAGLAVGAFAVTALVLRPVAGRLTDTLGRRPLLAGGALLAAVLMLLTGLADTLPLVVALRLGVGVAEAAFFVASFAALADLAPPARLGEALSDNSLGLYLGLTLGPPLGEILVGSLGFTAAWCGAAALLVLAASVVLGIGESRTLRPSGGARPPLILVRALAPALGFLASVVAIGGFLTLASLHASGVGVVPVSLPLAVYGMVVVARRIAFARLPDRFPALPLGAAALVLIGAGMSVAAAWTTPAGLVLGAGLLGVGVSFSTPAFFAAIFARVGPTERGAASGTASACLDLGLGGGSIALGHLAEGLGIPWAFGVAAAVALAGSVWTISLARRTRIPTPPEATGRRFPVATRPGTLRRHHGRAD